MHWCCRRFDGVIYHLASFRAQITGPWSAATQAFMLYLSKNKPLSLLTAAFCLALFTYSCKKDEAPVSEEVQAQLNLATQVLQANQALSQSAVSTSQGTKEKGSGLVGNTADDRCGSLTVAPLDPNVFPKTLTFDYGNGCTDQLGIERAGTIQVALAKLWEPGATASVEYGNYTENKVKVNGKVSLSNVSTNTGIGLELAVSNLKRTEVNGTESSLQSTLTLRQTVGALTFWDWTDDVYEMTGTTQLALADGQTASMSISAPLTKSNNCAWASKGTAALIINGLPMSVDYGNGTCDNKAIVTINGVGYTIYL